MSGNSVVMTVELDGFHPNSNHNSHQKIHADNRNIGSEISMGEVGDMEKWMIQ